MTTAGKLRLWAGLVLVPALASCEIITGSNQGEFDFKPDIVWFFGVEVGSTAVIRLDLISYGILEHPGLSDIEVVSLNPAIAQVELVRLDSANEAALDIYQMFSVHVKGISPGVVTIKAATTSGNPQFSFAPAEINIEVHRLDLVAEITPSLLFLTLTETGQFFCTVKDLAGGEVPHPAPRWRSTDPDIVSVDTDGTVTALAAGSAVIACSIQNTLLQATGRVTVSATSSVPTPDAIAGPYFVTGPRLNNTCPPNFVPFNLATGVEARVTQESGVPIIFLADSEVRGEYHQDTGQWDATGESFRFLGGEQRILRESYRGRWEPGPPVKWSGQFVYEVFTSDHATKICEATYDATFTRS